MWTEPKCDGRFWASHRVVDVEGSSGVSSSDVVGEQCVAPAVCIPGLHSAHRGVDGGSLTDAGVVRQVKNDRVVIIDVQDQDADHHLRKEQTIVTSLGSVCTGGKQKSLILLLF